jgi:methionyl-tRNA synthetase
MITIDDFIKVEMRAGTVLEAEEIPGSDKLLKLKIDLGEETPRQVLSGIKQWYQPEDLIGKQFVFVANLEPRMMMGLESQAMILAVGTEGAPVILKPSKKVKPGSKVR